MRSLNSQAIIEEAITDFDEAIRLNPISTRLSAKKEIAQP